MVSDAGRLPLVSLTSSARAACTGPNWLVLPPLGVMLMMYFHFPDAMSLLYLSVRLTMSSYPYLESEA